jgi:hypothetical protein
MWDYANSFLITLLACIGFSYYVVKVQAPQWELRSPYGGALKKSLNTMLGTSIAGASLLSLGMFFVTGSVTMASIYGILGYFLAFSAQTDMDYHRVPAEFSTLAIWYGIAAGAYGLLTGNRTVMYIYGGDPLQYSLISLGVSTLVFILIFISIMFYPKGIGWADVKMFFAVGFAVSWHLGYVNMIAIFMVTNIILFLQLIITRLISKRRGNFAVLPAFALAVVISSLFLLSNPVTY